MGYRSLDFDPGLRLRVKLTRAWDCGSGFELLKVRVLSLELMGIIGQD